jgi:hypothetical protein
MELYRFGPKAMHLQVTELQSKVPFFQADDTVNIIPETPDASWWVWTGPVHSEWDVPGRSTEVRFHWKASYTVAGEFVNQARSRLKISVELSEDELTAQKVLMNHRSCGTGFLDVTGLNEAAKQQGIHSAPHDFTAITQTWDWLVKAAWIITGPLMKFFYYNVKISNIEDDYGNAYPDVVTPNRRITVGVSAVKLALALTALANSALAAATAVIAAFFPPAWGAVGTFETIAVAAGIAALDPPTPSSSYTQPVSMGASGISKELRDDPSLAPLGHFLELTSDFLIAYNARSECQDRLLGARIAGDWAAVEMQNAFCVRTEQQMRRIACELPAATTAAAGAVQSASAFAPQRSREVLETWRKSGIPSEYEERWSRANVPGEPIELVSALDDSEQFEALISWERYLHTISEALQSVARNITPPVSDGTLLKVAALR